MDIRVLSGPEIEAAEADLASLLQQCVHGGASLGFLEPMSETEALDFWRRLRTDFESGSRLLVIACEGDSVVGTGHLAFEWKPNGKHRAEISKVLVRPSHRRRGIAARIMFELERVARDRGLRLLYLDTSEGRGGAQRFYESLGYLYAGGIPEWALDPDGTPARNAIYYKLLS